MFEKNSDLESIINSGSPRDLFILVEEVLVEVVVEDSPEIWMLLTVTCYAKGHLSYDCPEKQKTDKDVSKNQNLIR